MHIVLPVIIVAVIGLIVGLGLSLASKFMAVPVDEREEKIKECLPGANCGACGFSGCDGYAAAIASGEAAPDLCAPGGSATAQKLGEILGVTVSTEPKKAFIACAGAPDTTLAKYAYSGMMSCSAANLVHLGPLECEYGCIGFGDCANACPFDAITVINGRPNVCADKCVGCGKCVAACPKSLISLKSENTTTVIKCSNKAKGAAVAKACKVSCIACKMCEKACEKGAIKVVDNLAQIDYSLCDGCGKCKDACKRNVIM